MRSSGQYATTTPRQVECHGGESSFTFPIFGTGPAFTRSWDCTFTGVVDVYVDPEGRTAGWTCPVCGVEHELDFDTLTEES